LAFDRLIRDFPDSLSNWPKTVAHSAIVGESDTGWQAMIDGIYLLHEDLAQHLSRSD